MEWQGDFTLIFEEGNEKSKRGGRKRNISKSTTMGWDTGQISQCVLAYIIQYGKGKALFVFPEKI